jgi:outer membrane protein TolC
MFSTQLRIPLLAFVLAIAAPAAAQEPVALASATLRQCYDWATRRSEDLKIRQEDVLQSKARGHAAFGDALPHVEWEFNDTWQDPKGVDKLDRQGFGGFVEKNQKDSNFSVRQPIFSGLREFSARAGFEHQSVRDALLLERASKELFEQTANAFYAVVSLETEGQNTQTTLALAQDRIKELRSFQRLGKARESEIFTAEAHAAAIQANLQQIHGRLVSAREELSWITGQDLSSRPLLDEIPSPPAFGTLEDALAQAKNRTDLKAQMEDVEARRLQTRYEQGSYWPSADLTGRYYTQRATYLDAIDWDIVLALRVPLYQGGTVAARVREALSAHRQALWRLEEMERRVFASIRKTHSELTASLDETVSLQTAAQSAQKSYDALRKEYRLGLTTNLEVLEALDFLQTQKSAYDDARLRAKQLFLQLNVATEKMP